MADGGHEVFVFRAVTTAELPVLQGLASPQAHVSGPG